MIKELRGFTEMSPGTSMRGESSELPTAANRAWRCKKNNKGSNWSGMKVCRTLYSNTQTSYSPDWGRGDRYDRMSGRGDR